MIFRYIFLFFLLISGHGAMAQDFSVDRKIQKIDSLIQYSRFDVAQNKTDSLYNLLDNFRQRKKHKSQLLELRFRQALILDRQHKSPADVLEILQGITSEVKTARLPPLSYHIYLLMALSHEKADNFELADKYLKEAHQVYKEHKLESLYSAYCIRRSSYYRWTGNLDSVSYYAKKANEYAQKYGNEKDLIDSYILLGSVAVQDKNYTEMIEYQLQLLSFYKKLNDSLAISTSFNGIAIIYGWYIGDFHQALRYNDSAKILNKSNLLSNDYLLDIRYRIFESLGEKDSAYYYLKQYINQYKLRKEEDEKTKTKELEEQYQNDKKEATIKSKNQQMIFIISLLVVIVISTLLVIRQNRKIKSRNKIINEQLGDLSRTLEQKQVLLSELQHRVKNNLQHVISILEIQKESVDFNNIDELIRGNQNRIHSMALLHKKLNVKDNVNEVDLKKYIIELSELVKDSYNNHKKKINLNIKCEMETISIEKALPLGLIIVELVSNSMKHAFKKRNIGIINIEFTKGKSNNKLYYADNGSGFDFNKTSEKGLGQEIIKGLIDQLNGKTEANNNNGFELKIYFN